MIVLGLGGNSGDRLENLRRALQHLKAIPTIRVEEVSPLYESDALLPPGAPAQWDLPYLNLAVGITTKLQPEQLLSKIKTVEIELGRAECPPRWAPRPIDIDILTWHEESYHSNNLHIPHKDILTRPFVLWPLADIAPTWKYCLPHQSVSGKSAQELGEKFGSRFTGRAPLHTKQLAHRIDLPRMVGILNITPDSFSDGGNFLAPEPALTQAKELFAAGAELIDIGAESTNPKVTHPITAAEEWRRLQPLLANWHSFWSTERLKPKLSIDSRNPETIAQVLAYHIDYLNDVSGLTNPHIQQLVAPTATKLIFMHNLGIPANPAQILPKEQDTITSVYRWAEHHLAHLTNLGIAKDRLIFDVGIGFGKDGRQSLTLLKNITQFHKLGIPLLVGHSRKSFLNLFTTKPFAERDLESAAISDFLATQQVAYLRVHNVAAHMSMLKIKAALSPYP